MRLIRFMSQKELGALLSGETLHNNTNHHNSARRGRTDSVGFCFFDLSEPPEERMEYLTGVVCMDAVVEIEMGMELHEGYGMYRDVEKDNITNIFEALLLPPPMRMVKEYSTTEYDLDTCKIIRIGKPVLEYPHRINWENREVVPEGFKEHIMQRFGRCE